MVAIYVWSYYACAYFVPSFVLLHASDFHIFYMSMNYAGHILMSVSIVV